MNPPPTHGIRVLVVAVIVPAAVTIASLVTLIVLASSGPARVATHWGFAGQANGYGSPFTYPILMATIAVPLVALLGGGSVVIAHRGALSPVIKLTAVASVWMSVFLSITLIGSLLRQRTVSSVSAPSSPGTDLLIGAVVAIALGVGAWFVLPAAARRSAGISSPSIPAVALQPGERVTWFRTASVSRGVLLVLIGATLVIGAAEVLVIFATSGRAWWVAFVPAVLLIILLCNFAWSVRVDSRGVRIRSAVGVPSVSIPLDNIVSAGVVDVKAIGEFGGFGIRWSLNGRIGIILRSGEALEVRRRKGLDVVVTVDDATTAAALVNALVQREAHVS